MSVQTVSYYHNYDKEKIEDLRSDPNITILSSYTEVGDTIHLLPMHLEPSTPYLLYRTTYKYVRGSSSLQSPRQDATSTSKVGQGPKTRGGTNEFISAFWVNGKPKCREGYRYDFSRKMCRLIK